MAGKCGIAVTGALISIAEAAARGWIDLDAGVHRRRTKTRFRVAESLVATVRRQASQNPDLP